MITAVRTERAWLQQSHGCLPVLLVHSCKGTDIYIKCKCEPLTEQLRCHLSFTPPPPEERTSYNQRADKDHTNLERLIWTSGTQPEIVRLLKAGFQPPDDEHLQAKAKRAERVMAARHEREIAREAQQQESEQREAKRAAKPQRKGTRPPLINNPMPTKPVPTTNRYDEWITKKIEDLLLKIEVTTVIQPKTTYKL